MTEGSLAVRHSVALAAVHEFFAQYYGDEIAFGEDAEADRAFFYVGIARRVVAVCADFLERADAIEIRERLAAWNVAHLSRTLERGCVLAVTSEGPEEEREASF